MTAVQPWPTSAAATAALKAAARKAYENPDPEFPDYDDLPEPVRRQVEEDLLPLIWAALQAVSDPRYAAWEQGYSKGSSAIWNGETTNPYSSGV